ncbi:MAG: hypothetical protein KatS3mg059_0355 [Thermomicrobiales bacterium]|nr:MAG: hypothetical protein KatS3mg059_0355 [Thermomicrobiales bacterium]
MIVVSLFASTLFLGGTDGPGSDRYWGLGILWLLAKAGLFLFFYVWLRATLPRFRYDQLMGVAWKVLLPLVLLNIVITSFIRLASNVGIPASWWWVIGAGGVVILAILGMQAIASGKRTATATAVARQR